MRMKNRSTKTSFVCLILVLSLVSCNDRGSKDESTEATAEEAMGEAITEPVSAENDDAASVMEETPIETLYQLIKMRQFDQAKSHIESNNLNLDDFFSTEYQVNWAKGERLLPRFSIDCELEVVEFLLSQGADPNQPSLTIFIDEWDSATIPENFDIEDKSKVESYRGNGLIEDFPMGYALSCDSPFLFYLLLNSGASQSQLQLKGAIKWSDKTLINKLIEQKIMVDFIPYTSDTSILNMLKPVTDGKQYSELDYGEGGEVIDTDLMTTVLDSNLPLTKFMLEVGADPNVCMTLTYDTPRSDGTYPIRSASSIAKENYENSSNQVDKEILELLVEYGAKELESCET